MLACLACDFRFSTKNNNSLKSIIKLEKSWKAYSLIVAALNRFTQCVSFLLPGTVAASSSARAIAWLELALPIPPW